MLEQHSQSFQGLFHSIPQIHASAPGRINIIGEHTDYNGGYVLPAAIHLRTHVLAARRPDDFVHARAENFGESASFSLESLRPSPKHHWTDYVQGICAVLREEGFRLGGLDLLIWGDVPLGAGLSSSAALEISLLRAVTGLFDISLPREKIARLGQKAEHEFAGVKCGLMDQFISVFGRKNQALFLDCETLAFEYYPLNLEKAGLIILVYDTQVRRSLAASEYNKRRREAGAALDVLKAEGAAGYKTATLEMLESARGRMESVPYKRARHIIREDERVKQTVAALKKDDFLSVGRYLFQSHESLRDDYEVSSAELDLVYDLGRDFPDCYGARMVGAGFGGSAIALIKASAKDAFKEKALEAARQKRFPQPVFRDIFVGEGASAVLLDQKNRP
jgi:galactokinase